MCAEDPTSHWDSISVPSIPLRLGQPSAQTTAQHKVNLQYLQHCIIQGVLPVAIQTLYSRSNETLLYVQPADSNLEELQHILKLSSTISVHIFTSLEDFS
jgi:hypothetical protein